MVRRKVSPNGISVMSTVFAVAGAAAILGADRASGSSARLSWFGAAALMQLRLLANLFDGMVALESGRASPVGELFNEVPDRVSDAAVFIALGLVVGSSPHLGYGAAVLAVFTAYLRAVGAAAGAGQIFAGVMAKPQRMFLVTLLCLFEAAAPDSWKGAWVGETIGAPGVVLAVISIGCAVTAWTRLTAIASKLRAGA